MEKVSRNLLEHLLVMMLRIRQFELAVEKNFQLGHIYGTAHLAIGQEASAVGAISALKPNDLISSTHRGHGHCIAKGADLKLMMAEIFGRSTGYCKGKGGSMHIADVSAGNLGANGIVAGSAAIATGAALAAKKMGTGQIVICFEGDGAINEGIWHEAANMASIWKLPVIYLCENNQYGMGMPIKKATNLEKLSDRAKGYNIHGETIDGNDVLAVYKTVSRIAEDVRAGKGPALIECITYRIRGHSLRDAQRYRPEGEAKKWLDTYCPIERFKKYLTKSGYLKTGDIDALLSSVNKEIEEAVKFALESPFLDASRVTEDIYA
ncbi:MAG: thiamine pyrophosphate-dependent dehydrogenase E1 component subunit alpha [Actinobacteria bacterium]|nr:thiamine pyrophosphate-dependent dehydrogenase E1 component subunit alpha [Actinomycetota bacterium]